MGVVHSHATVVFTVPHEPIRRVHAMDGPLPCRGATPHVTRGCEPVALNALASSQRMCRREARRNTIGDDQTSRIRILSAPFDHASGGPR